MELRFPLRMGLLNWKLKSPSIGCLENWQGTGMESYANLFLEYKRKQKAVLKANKDG